MKEEKRRPKREDLFMEFAHMMAERSTCLRADVGVVAVVEGRIIGTGYNGAPKGMPHCLDVGCQMDGEHCERAVHAEANLIAWSARVGTSLRHSELYCTHQPCFTCSKLIINAGIVGVHYCEEYGPADSISLLREADVLTWHQESC